MSTILRALIVQLVILVSALGSSYAQQDASTTAPREQPKRHYGFIETSGAFGFQFGVQPYLPDGSATQFKHPITTGFSVNATAGWECLRKLALILNYEYADVSSRKGDIPNVLDKVQGTVNYHTLVVGIRSYRRLGPGKLGMQFAAGIVFPFDTELKLDYAPALAALPQPIQGRGERVSKYGLGYGAHGQIGYYLPIAKGFYVGTALRVHSFQVNNNGKKLQLDNFVDDFAAPTPVTLETRFDDDGGPAPTNYSVQAIRLHISVGYRF